MPSGPIILPNPGPTLDIAEAEAAIQVIKSNPLNDKVKLDVPVIPLVYEASALVIVMFDVGASATPLLILSVI